MSSIIARRSLASSGLIALLGTASAWGQSQPNQTLDQVDAFNANAVLQMAFDRPNPPDFSTLALGTAGAGLSACKLAGSSLYCLAKDNAASPQAVRQWKIPLAGQPVDRFYCNDISLGLDAGACTGLTVDLSGAIWVSGRKKNSPANYSLVKVVEKTSPALPNGCPNDGWIVLTAALPTALCAKEFATGPGLLSDLDAVDGSYAQPPALLPLLPGILALTDSNQGAALYFDLGNPSPPTAFDQWGVVGSERLVSTTLLQRKQTVNQVPDVVVGNYILAATSKGQILSKDVALSPSDPPRLVFTIPQATPRITIDSSTWSPCITSNPVSTCIVQGATLTATGANYVPVPFNMKAPLAGIYGLGIAGNAGGEIAIDEHVTVQFPGSSPYPVTAIQIVFLFNGPEYDDRAEVAQVTADGTPYTLTVSSSADDAAVWSGPGSVTSCSPTTIVGAGCFLITNPFPGPVSLLSFTALHGGTPLSGPGTNDSDFAIGKIEAGLDYNLGIRTSFTTGRAYVSDRNTKDVRALLPAGDPSSYVLNQLPDNGELSTGTNMPDGLTVAPGVSVDLATCSTNCDVLKDASGATTLKLSGIKLAPGSPSGVTVFQVKNIPDCRYVPQVCLNLLTGHGAATDDDARQALLTAGWIVASDPANKLNPAAELLNATPLLPEDVTSQFPPPPNGLPPLYISRQYRGQTQNSYRFDAFFYKTAQGVQFLDTLVAEIDVLKLAGKSLGCTPNNAKLLDWDVVTRVSETYKSVGGAYIDTITNVDCGTTKTKPPGLSLVPYNLELAPDTYGPTVKSLTPRVTVKNDAVFARLVQSLWDDVGTSRRDLACKQVDTLPAGGAAPLSSTDCNKLAGLWSVAKFKLDLCVATAFGPKNAAGTALCDLAKKYATDYQNALAVTTATGPDVANRLGEQKARVATFLHVFETRFRPSIKMYGYCREWTAPNYAGCPAP